MSARTHTSALSPQLVFDYGELKAADIKACESAVERISKFQRRIAGDIIAIGKELLAVKERLEHGQFGPWLKHHFGWSQSSAYRMMDAAKCFGEIPKLGNLTIDQSALYLLSSDKCDDDTRDEIIQRAESGERITHKMVKETLGDDDHEPPSYEEKIDKVVDRIRSLANDEHRCLLIARLKVICEELSFDE